MKITIDTETHLIQPGAIVPRLVCLQYAVDDLAVNVVSRDDLPDLAQLFRGNIIVGHHIAFDFAVLRKHDPGLSNAIWEAYKEGRVRDTLIREKLADIAKGAFKKNRKEGYSLSAIATRYGFKKDSDDPWRLRYAELDGVPIKKWPLAALNYAQKDVMVTRAVYNAQADLLTDEIPQTRYAWTMHAIGANGVRTDEKRTEKLISEKEKQHEKDAGKLKSIGFVRENETRDTKLVKKYVKNIYDDHPPMTKGTEKTPPSVSLSEETLLESGDPDLITYQRYGSHKGLIKRLKRLREGYHHSINARFNSLVDSGRTSCIQGKSSGFQLQNVPSWMRVAFDPGPGNMFVTVDYNQAELHTLAQVCYNLFGESLLGDALNSGVDVHSLTASKFSDIPYDRIMKRKDMKGSKESTYRSAAKAANFGFPGFMGINTTRRHLKAKSGIDFSMAEMASLKRAWLRAYPEMGKYFRYINHGLHWTDGRSRLTHLTSHRIRGGVTPMEAANSFFQGLAADMAKCATFVTHYACENGHLKGWDIWNFVHDEICLRGPVDEPGVLSPQKVLEEVIRIMIRVGLYYVPDCPVRAEGKVSKLWQK